jgi:hypothetical protein
MHHLRGVEPAEEEADKGRPVGATEATQEGAVGHVAAEGGAGCGGAPDVGEGRQQEEDLREEVVGEEQNRWRGVLVLGVGLRWRGHLFLPNHLQQKDPLMEKIDQNLGWKHDGSMVT